jgi:short-subunit dehydrogenase
VSATCVHPGGIKTNIARAARIDPSVAGATGTATDASAREFEKSFITSPEKAAKVIVRGIERNQRRVLIGPDAHLFNLLGRLPASVAQRLIGLGAKRQL